LLFTACAALPDGLFPTKPAPAQSFPGKIAIFTDSAGDNSEEYLAARHMVEKYGEDKIIHEWTDGIMDDIYQRDAALGRIAADPEIKALIINPATPAALGMVDALRENRDDIFTVICTPPDSAAGMVARAALVLDTDLPAMGSAMVLRAKSMGAQTFVHYSFPRHMEQPQLAQRRERILEKCRDLGVEFVDATCADPLAELGMAGARQFILEDVPRMVEQYGKDTAFFASECGVQAPLIQAVVESGAIYPQPCCPSPFHGFPLALGLIADEDEDMGLIEDVIADTIRTLKERDMLGRLSTWPVPAPFLFTHAGVEYIVKRLNGEVAQDGIDLTALEKCMKDYAGVDCFITVYTDDAGTEYANFLLARESYLTYDDKLYDET